MRRALLAAALLAGCIDDLDPKSIITGPRIVGDSVFLVGVGSLVWFMAGLKFGWSLERGGARSTARVELGGNASART